MSSNKQSVAIIGAGTIFDSHASAYREIGQSVTTVVDIDKDRAAQAGAKFGIPNVATDWRGILDRDDVDIVDVCTPPKFHAEIVIAALQAGKHVVCEKPLAPNLAEVDRILEAEAVSTGKLLVVHQLRCQPSNQRLKWLVDGGHLGCVCFARALRYDAPPADLVERGVWGSWELAGGGVLMTKAIHQLDLLCWLLGPVRRVQAMMRTFVNRIESEDHVTANIEFENGALASVSVSGAPYGYSEHFDVIGDAGTASSHPWRMRLVDRARERELQLELDRRFPLPSNGFETRVHRFARRAAGRAGIRMRRPQVPNWHAALFRKFFTAIETDTPMPVSAADARTVVELCTAIYASAITGEAVELPLDSSHPFYHGVTTDEYSGSNV